MALAELLDEGGNPVDEVVVSYFAAPRSYTAEDVVEISCHGSPVVLRHCVARALAAGARAAEPGEFTLRAYLNGRIDLPQAEAVEDLIRATTLHQARIAAQQMEGAVSRALRPSKEELLELIALLEAGIDFAEDDVSVATNEEILAASAAGGSGVAAADRQFWVWPDGARRAEHGDCGTAECGEEQFVQCVAEPGPGDRDGDARNDAGHGVGAFVVGGDSGEAGGHCGDSGERRCC